MPAVRLARPSDAESRRQASARPSTAITLSGQELNLVKIVAAAIQLQTEPAQVAANVDRADALLDNARRAGAAVAVLPEMFNTGYALLPDFGCIAEGADGPTLRHLSRRSCQWHMGIAAGFVERHGRDLYDALALCLPDGAVYVYRKRLLVFWERFRFRPGRSSLVVQTPWGRLGLAICADMIQRQVWEGYRGRIDLAVVAAAWPEFACRRSGKAHWAFGPLGPLAATIPARVARDLDVPVIFANQCGATRTTIPLLGLGLVEQIADRFAGRSSICDGRAAPPVVAGTDPQLILSEVTLPHLQDLRPCPSTSLGFRGLLFRSGIVLTDLMGSLSYWRASLHRPARPTAWSWSIPEIRHLPEGQNPEQLSDSA